jgi:hypothetical protein
MQALTRSVGRRATRIGGLRRHPSTDGQGKVRASSLDREAAMTDPRNKMHDKRVQQEKKHQHQEIKPGAAQKVQPGKKPQMIKEQPSPQPEPQMGGDETAAPDNPR